MPFLKIRLILLMSLSMIFASIPFAQTRTGNIQGKIRDQAGGVLPGVTVTARELATGFTRSVITSDAGDYRLLLLPVGDYELTAELPSFAKLVQSPVPLLVGQTLQVDLILKPSVAGEQVTVTGAAPLIEVSQSKVAEEINERAIANLPVNGRNFLDFVLLTPGVTRDHRSGDLAFGGLRGTNNSLQVDGADNNNTFFGQSIGRTGVRAPYQFSQDAVQEFQVNTNSYSAEYGRAGGAVINAVTKSGANDFHGGGFWFFRDRSLNASDFFSNKRGRDKPPFHANQMGGSIGGPIIKDKAFFFFDLDLQRLSLPNVVIPGGGGFVPPTDPVSLAAFQELLPLGQTFVQSFSNDVSLLKGDWTINPNHRFSFRWNRQEFTGLNLENGGQTRSVESTGNSNVDTQTYAFSLNSVLSNRMVNEFRFQYAKDNEPGTANSDRPQAEIRERGRVVLTIGRNFFSPRQTRIRRGQFIDNFTYSRGNHILKFGADFNIDRTLNFFPGQFTGQFFFTSLAQFASRRPDRFVQAFAGEGTTGPLTFPNATEAAWYVEDSWKVRSNLTLNLGLRYDIQDINDPPTANPDPGLASLGLRTDRINLDKNNFGPRFGFAWSPFGNNRLVVRGGYGVFYSRTTQIMAAQAHSQNGLNVQVLTFTGDAAPLFPNNFATPLAGGAASTPSIFVFEPNFVNPFIQQASFGLEHELASNLSVSASYLFVKGDHLPHAVNINLLPSVPFDIELVGTGVRTIQRFPGRRLSNFNRITQFQSSGNSNYHAMVLSLQKRFSNHLQFLASYTVSKAIDDSPDATSVVAFSSGDDAKQVQDPFNLRDSRGLSDLDIRQRFVLSWNWDLAYARNLANPFARRILDGWSLSGIFTAQSSPPFSAIVNSDLNKDTNARTDRVPGFGRNTFQGFEFNSFDLRVTREVRVHERARLEFIFEAFNLLNQVNFQTIQNSGALPSVTAEMFTLATSGPNAGKLVPRADFGAPNAVFDPRIIQFAAKIHF